MHTNVILTNKRRTHAQSNYSTIPNTIFQQKELSETLKFRGGAIAAPPQPWRHCTQDNTVIYLQEWRQQFRIQLHSTRTYSMRAQCAQRTTGSEARAVEPHCCLSRLQSSAAAADVVVVAVVVPGITAPSAVHTQFPPDLGPLSFVNECLQITYHIQ